MVQARSARRRGRALAGVGATARIADAAPSANAPIKVGIIYSRTGALRGLRRGVRLRASGYGLDYATKGTNKVNGHKIELTLVDDGTDAAKAVAGREGPDRQGLQDHRRLDARRASRLAGRAARRPEQGPLHLRPGRDGRGHRASTGTRSARAARRYQDVLTAATRILGERRSARRSSSSPRTSRSARATSPPFSDVFGDTRPQRWTAILVPAPAQDFTPFAQQAEAAERRPRSSSPGPARRRRRCGRRSTSRACSTRRTVVTGSPSGRRGRVRAGAARRSSSSRTTSTSAPKNEVNDWLVKKMRKRGQAAGPLHAGRLRRRPDDRPRARRAAATDVDEDDLGARGLELHGPEGPARIRAADHAMLQPMFQVKLVQSANEVRLRRRWREDAARRATGSRRSTPFK